MYSANTIGLRSLWHLDELFLTKFPLKWCIVCICSWSGSRNIYKSVLSLKLQFSWICTFFHEKKKEKNSSNSGKSFFTMAAKKRCDSIAIFLVVQFIKNCTRITSFLGRHREKWLAAIWQVFFLFFREKSYKFAKIAIWQKIHFYRYFKNQISYRYIQYIILKEI